MSKVHVRKGDTVVLLTGKYNDKFESANKRKTGKVLEVSPKEGKVIVEGINFVTKHVKPTRMGQVGGIVKVLIIFKKMSLKPQENENISINSSPYNKLKERIDIKENSICHKCKSINQYLITFSCLHNICSNCIFQYFVKLF